MGFSDVPRPPQEIPGGFDYPSDNRGPSGFAGAEVGETMITASRTSGLNAVPSSGIRGYDMLDNPFLPPAEPFANDSNERTQSEAPNRTVAGVGKIATETTIGQTDAAAAERAEPVNDSGEDVPTSAEPDERSGEDPAANPETPQQPGEETDGFGAYIRQLREDAGLTRQDIITEMRTSSTNYSAFEGNKWFPRPGYVEALMRKLGVPDEVIAEQLAKYTAQREQALAETKGAEAAEPKEPASGQSEGGEPREFSTDRVMIRILAKRGLTARDLTPPREPGRKGMHPLMAGVLIPQLLTDKTYAQIAKETGLSVSAVLRNTQALAEAIRKNPDYVNMLPQGLLEVAEPRHNTEFTSNYDGVGTQLRDLARERKIPYREIAKQLGVSVDVLFRLHNGKNKPAPWLIDKYTQIVGVDPEQRIQLNEKYKSEYTDRRGRPELRRRGGDEENDSQQHDDQAPAERRGQT